VEALQRVLKHPIAKAIPYDPGQARALSQGKPLALTTPESPLAQAVAQLATELGIIGETAGQETAPTAERR
jgi:MinD-like ATPase involved in chromosome partitioning or flagellar assembly